jgi:hypothetical protein
MVSSVLLAQMPAYWVARPDSSYRQRVFIIVPQGRGLPTAATLAWKHGRPLFVLSVVMLQQAGLASPADIGHPRHWRGDLK